MSPSKNTELIIDTSCDLDSNFRQHSVHVSFIKLRLYAEERVSNRILFTSLQNSKYFKFYGTLNSNRNRLRMPCFFLSPFSHSSPYFWQLSNRTTSIKLGMQLPNNITHGVFRETTKNLFYRSIFLVFESLFTEPIGVLFDYRCLRTSVNNSKYSISILNNYIETILKNCMQFVHIDSHTCLSSVKFFVVILVIEGLTCNAHVAIWK